MLFNSIEFPIFFGVVFTLYCMMRSRLLWQNVLLLIASYIFYGWWDVRFLFLIVLSTAIDYSTSLMMVRSKISVAKRIQLFAFVTLSAFAFVVVRWSAVQTGWFRVPTGVEWQSVLPDAYDSTGRISVEWLILIATTIGLLLFNVITGTMARWSDVARRRTCLWISMISNLALLGFFKYFNFFAENFAELSQTLLGTAPSQLTLDIVLPVGISFYTFQTMSYTIDVFRGEVEPSDDFIEFAAYVAFFPQLVAGPIERGKHLLPQFRKPRPRLTLDAFSEGGWLIGWGLFKKMAVADRMGFIVNETFSPFDQLSNANPEMLVTPAVPDDGLTLWVALFAFAIQIYCDFSGYTDIARGTAKWMGFDIMLNFNLPYISRSPSEFWRRWHISLSTWLRDYLYIGLGGNRGGRLATYRNLMLTMLLGGLWHGAAWNFVLWGAFHGGLLCLYRAFSVESGAKDPWPRKLMMWSAMFVFTLLGWLLFRARNLATIALFLQSMFLRPFASEQTLLDIRQLLFYAWFLIVFQVLQVVSGKLNPVKDWHWFVQLNVWIFIIMSAFALAPIGKQEFIYFAF